MNEQTAKELVVRAGRELLESGLIARTWGNVSCRTDEQKFAVTPSGRSYETLQADEIVLCRIADCSYDGNIKPSSEKRIHALIYHTYPDVNFIIHTHQNWASCVGSSGITDMPSIGIPLLGDSVPVAAYGLPGTKKLMKGVGEALKRSRGSAIIMSHHGAVCFGRTYEEAFTAARQLETACFEFIRGRCIELSGLSSADTQEMTDFYVSLGCGSRSPNLKQPVFIGSSWRTADGFILKSDREVPYRFQDKIDCGAALVHKAVYESRADINVINQSSAGSLLSVSNAGLPLQPWLDDFAQIVGRNARCAAGIAPEQIVKALRGRNGVLVPGAGALCCAATEDDAHAVELVMIKDALAQIGTRFISSASAIGLPDCLLMHFVYTRSYSKKAEIRTK